MLGTYLVLSLLVLGGTVGRYGQFNEMVKPVIKEVVQEEIITDDGCYADCSETCPHGANFWEKTACQSKDCRHWIDVDTLHNCEHINGFRSMRKCVSYTTNNNLRTDICEKARKI